MNETPSGESVRVECPICHGPCLEIGTDLDALADLAFGPMNPEIGRSEVVESLARLIATNQAFIVCSTCQSVEDVHLPFTHDGVTLQPMTDHGYEPMLVLNQELTVAAIDAWLLMPKGDA